MPGLTTTVPSPRPEPRDSRNVEQGTISTLLNSSIIIETEGRITGVHAREMYAHFDFETPFDIPSLVHKLNSFTKDITI
jgi:tRNA pseudouridine38-40 synthase